MEYSYAVNIKMAKITREKGLKTTRVDDKAGFKRGTTWRIIKRKRRVYANEVLPICYALGVSVEELFGETEMAGPS